MIMTTTREPRGRGSLENPAADNCSSANDRMQQDSRQPVAQPLSTLLEERRPVLGYRMGTVSRFNVRRGVSWLRTE